MFQSIDKLTGRILNDFNITKQDLLTQRIADWVENAIEITDIQKYYKNKTELKTIENYKTRLPCGIKYLHSILVEGKTCGCGSNGLALLKIRNNPLIGSVLKLDYHNIKYGTINGNFLHTTFTNDFVIFVYKGIPYDEKGFPLVPQNAKLIEALEYYLIYRLSLSGYKHPVIDIDRAYKMWEHLYPKAANDVNWFDLTEYQEFTEMWNNLKIGDLANQYYLH